MISSAKIAKLANLPITDPSTYDGKLEETVKYVDVLKEIDTSNVPPTYQVGNEVNKTREDKIDKTRIVPVKKYLAKVVWN